MLVRHPVAGLREDAFLGEILILSAWSALGHVDLPCQISAP
jgi:hypothetical protein